MIDRTRDSGGAPRRSKGQRLLLLFAAALILIPIRPTAAAPPKQRQILILHSYHPEYPWTRGVIKGMNEVFDAATPRVGLHTEYLDTKRYHDPRYLSGILDTVMKYKLAGQAFDLLLVSDNDAFNFAMRHRKDLFAEIPMVFCGVNNFEPQALTSDGNLTGVAEVTSLNGTLELARTLTAGIGEIIVIGGTDNITDRLNRQNLLALLPLFQDRVRLTLWDNLTPEELTGRLSSLKPGQAVVMNRTGYRSRERIVPFSEAIRMIREACPVPLYGLWDFALGEGIVGGKLISARKQGVTAAQMALDILAGTPAGAIPIISNDANEYIFDDNELRRFHIPDGRLPAGSGIINRPLPFYSIDKTQLWGVVGFTAALLILCLALIAYSRARLRSEDRLKRLSSFQQSLMDAIPLPVYYKNREGSYLGCNSAMEKLLGLPRQQIIGRSARDLFPADLSESFAAADRQLFAGGGTQIYQSSMVSPAGVEREFLFHKALFEEEEQAGVIGTILDVTERHRAEEALKAALKETESARAHIDLILKSVADGLLVTDREHRVVLLNRAAQDLLEVSQTTAVGHPMEQILGEIGLQRQIESILGGGEPPPPFEWSTGGGRVIEARSSAALSREGTTTGVIIILRDVTREREIDRMKNEFISTAAHELRTPLTSVMGFAEILQAPDRYGVDSPQRQKELLCCIYEKGQALERIIGDLLDLSRIQSGQPIRLTMVTGDIRATLEQAVRLFPLPGKDHHIALELPEGSTPLIHDRDKIGQVMDNLLSNAVKFSPLGGEIRVRGRVDGQRFLVSVIDEGIGMTADQAERIFDKFYRVDASNTASAGLGLGMSIARTIVEAHGGEILVQSAPGRGTTVSFALPLTVID